MVYNSNVANILPCRYNISLSRYKTVVESASHTFSKRVVDDSSLRILRTLAIQYYYTITYAYVVRRLQVPKLRSIERFIYKIHEITYSILYICFNVNSINVVVYGFSSDNNCRMMIAILMQYTTFVGTYNILCKRYIVQCT